MFGPGPKGGYPVEPRFSGMEERKSSIDQYRICPERSKEKWFLQAK